MRALIFDYLNAKHYKVVAQGEIHSPELLNCFDQQYSDMQKKALILAPSECSLSPTDMTCFEDKFGLSWQVAVKKNLVQNAYEAGHILGTSDEQLSKVWMQCLYQNKMVKLGRDFYCVYVDNIPDKPSLFVINGFFNFLRREYVAHSASVYYYCIEWNRSGGTWKDFSENVIGHENPTLSQPRSIRAVIHSKWKELGLDSTPDIIRNSVHASASAFESLVERRIWLSISLERDTFAIELSNAGIPKEVIANWITNISVMGKPLFSHMEYKDSQECIVTAKHLYTAANQRKCLTLRKYLLLLF